MEAITSEPFFFNPFDPATRRDPYALFARARREHPVWRHEGLPVSSVFRHAVGDPREARESRHEVVARGPCVR